MEFVIFVGLAGFATAVFYLKLKAATMVRDYLMALIDRKRAEQARILPLIPRYQIQLAWVALVVVISGLIYLASGMPLP